MESRKYRWWLGLALAVLLGAVGCSGILQELQYEDGSVERLRIQSGESWKTWDRNSTREDESSVILKKEATF
ncbi:MAG: hypothetical protein HY790_05610 [Deltaproteobacteria bacterium]|nr:hypothetical protein [Deltaproteobacteria bacterium]MBI4795302.1 hypothetical protein [Deltaproteobacteria bacterium]